MAGRTNFLCYAASFLWVILRIICFYAILQHSGPDEVPLFICMMSEGGSEWKNFGGQERKVTERTKER